MKRLNRPSYGNNVIRDHFCSYQNPSVWTFKTEELDCQMYDVKSFRKIDSTSRVTWSDSVQILMDLSTHEMCQIRIHIPKLHPSIYQLRFLVFKFDEQASCESECFLSQLYP